MLGSRKIVQRGSRKEGKRTEKKKETLENEQELRRLLVVDFFRYVSN